MTDQPRAAEAPAGSYDEIAQDLQRLRFAAGDVAYAEIVRRIAAHRERNGVDAGSARPARTTVYDAFRTGRTRVNPHLVGEIARVLGASEIEAAQWEERCLLARRNPPPAPAVMPEPAPSDPLPEVAETAAPANGRKLMLILACIVLNVLGFTLVARLGLPLYFDMVGTAIAAIALGPWAGVAVGLSTNAIGLGITDSSSIAFALVNVVGALVWGYGARRLRLCQTFPRYLLLNVLVALSCSVVATTLLVLLFNGGTGHASENTTRNLAQMGNPLSVAVLGSNVVHSLADKLLTGFIVLGALGAVRRWIEVPFYDTLSADVMLHLKAVGNPVRGAGDGSRPGPANLSVQGPVPGSRRGFSKQVADSP
ncbi:hypothetical protein GCM10009715_37760 [Paeniglutamicibacter psychrophenolicus]|uniref:Energy-coupling factor transport system substrate-specific component n=1 Tax=Paeniglutamicibacter psychrophenolicus TaxID=257454 RepID=A0ABS4W851_9MICC|nr:ECF transporter S component [Paeniglutamicibacter psychrophenolicus]MBP2372379.1 energy-coupling factor transport system substrate-specific component [Paeniglutamicibacter psychrophenolicus]